MRRRLLAVDLSYQAYRAAATHDKLTDAHGRFTGGLYGFIVSLSAAIEAVGATDVVLCQDKPPYRRSETYPNYKLLRKAGEDTGLRELADITKQQILAMAYEFDIPVWGVPGFEADDLGAVAARHYRHRFELVVSMSNDSDLFQLFDVPNFRIYKDAKSKLMDASDFRKRFNGISVEEYILASALQGTHNDIEGIDKVGPVTAIKIVKDAALLRRYYGDHGELIQRNMGLIRLPHPLLPDEAFVMPTCRRRGSFAAAGLYRFCMRYDIEPMPWWGKSFDAVLG